MKTKTKTKTKKSSTNVPRLDAIAFKTFTKALKKNADLKTLLENSPFAMEMLKDIQKNVRAGATTKISAKKNDLSFIFTRFLHINIIHAILTLFSHEPDCLIVFHLPHNNMKVEIYTDRDDAGRTIYLVDTYRNNQIQKNLAFWNKDEFVWDLFDLFKQKMPKNVAIFRSSISIAPSPLHLLIQNVNDAFGETEISKRIINLYNRHDLKNKPR